METLNESKFTSQRRSVRRVAVKFIDKFKLPYYVDGAEKDFPRDWRKRWNVLVEIYPEITLKCIYTTVSPKGIQAMVDEARERTSDYQPPNFLTFFALDVSSLDIAKKLAAALAEWEIVEYSYVESLPMPLPLNSYLGPPNLNPAAPGFMVDPNIDIGGIDVSYAWKQNGGTGKGVKFIDIEKSWCLTHPDLPKISGPLPDSIDYGFDSSNNAFSETQHGTSILGILAANKNQKGIAYEATGTVVSPWLGAKSFPEQPALWNVANAIMNADKNLSPGDVLLLELQVEVQNFQGLWPVECEGTNFAAIQLATARGIIVVEAAGNGNLDFDASSSPFNRNPNKNPYYNQDSGAIIVGAANPQDQDQGIISGRRFSLSNYGTRVNCFAWGDSVDTLDADPTTGKCTDLQGKPLPDETICTQIFGGTSAATAIIAGAAIVLQGIAKNRFSLPLTALQMRNILSDSTSLLSGSTSRINTLSTNPAIDKIGVMPNLQSIIKDLNLLVTKYPR